LSGIIENVSLGIASHQAGSYQVTTPVYEGPLDLLLQLIERAELDITKLALAQVTDQYLEHLKVMQARRDLQGPEGEEGLAAEEVSAFLVIAAKLLQIKSEALLPRPPEREPGEEDPGEALAAQLIAYKKYRKIAELLGQREASQLRTYLRLAPPPKIEGTVDLSGLGLADLLAAAQAVLKTGDQRPALSTVVTPPRITIREKIRWITHQLRSRGQATFRSLLGNRITRLDVVVTFLAMLELVKRHLVIAHQEQLFGEIELQTDQSWNDEVDFDLEFGE
jgi:segregation and condensation protein A